MKWNSVSVYFIFSFIFFVLSALWWCAGNDSAFSENKVSFEWSWLSSFVTFVLKADGAIVGLRDWGTVVPIAKGDGKSLTLSLSHPVKCEIHLCEKDKALVLTLFAELESIYHTTYISLARYIRPQREVGVRERGAE